MMAWISENLATIVVGLAVLGIVVLVVRSMYKNKKAGKSCSCGSSCSGCASAGMCHTKPQDK